MRSIGKLTTSPSARMLPGCTKARKCLRGFPFREFRRCLAPEGAVDGEVCWAIETSKDGDHWRFFGRAWKRPGEPVILHAVPRFVRFRQLDP